MIRVSLHEVLLTPRSFSLRLSILPHFQGPNGLIAVVDELHQAFAHEVRPLDAVVPLAVFAETEENRVDRHAVDADEGVGDEVSAQRAQEHRDPNVLHDSTVAVVVFQLDEFDADEDGRDDDRGFAQEQDEGAHGVDGEDPQSVGRQQHEGLSSRGAKTVPVYR